MTGVFCFALPLQSVRAKPGFRTMNRAKRLFEDGFGRPYLLRSAGGVSPGGALFCLLGAGSGYVTAEEGGALVECG